MLKIISFIYVFFTTSPVIPYVNVRDLNNGDDTGYESKPVKGYEIGVYMRW